VIEAAAFFMNEIENLELPEPLKYIGSKAFQNNKLSKVVIPSQVVYIGEYAFANNPFDIALARLPNPSIANMKFLYWKGENVSKLGSQESVSHYNPGDIIFDDVRYTAVFED